jgi:hypothetical protein
MPTETSSGRSPVQNVHAAEPDEFNPEEGQLLNHDVVITDAVRWVEPDGTHVFRSTEFDAMGEGSDEESALRMFIENMEDLVSYLADLVREDPTEHELDAFVLLAQRFIEAQRRHEAESVPFIRVNFPRRRRPHGKRWRSLHENSSAALPA